MTEANEETIPLTMEAQRDPSVLERDFAAIRHSSSHDFLSSDTLNRSLSLPNPATASRIPKAPGSTPNQSLQPSKLPSITIGGTKLQPTAAIIIPIWIVLSSGVIIYNNYIYNTLNFRYPVFLVSWHLVFASIGTRVLARTTHLLDDAKETHISKDVYIHSILPIAVLFCGSLILSNKAYLYLSVSFIQMLKVCREITRLLTILTPSLGI
jgi:hypothetical protein